MTIDAGTETSTTTYRCRLNTIKTSIDNRDERERYKDPCKHCIAFEGVCVRNLRLDIRLCSVQNFKRFHKAKSKKVSGHLML